MNIPDYIPVLSHGSHKFNPANGACFMEMISFLSGKQEEGDHPSCVHGALIGLGIAVNDFVSDDNRNRLALLIPDFMGTKDIDFHMLKARVQQEVLPEFYNWYADKKQFEKEATSNVKHFSLIFVLNAIINTYQAAPDRLSNFAYDDAALSYIEQVSAIIRDMKPSEDIDLSVGKNHPSQAKVNV